MQFPGQALPTQVSETGCFLRNTQYLRNTPEQAEKKQFCVHAFKSSQVVAQFPVPRPALPKTAPADSSHVAQSQCQCQYNTQHAVPLVPLSCPVLQSASAGATQTRSFKLIALIALNTIKHANKHYTLSNTQLCNAIAHYQIVS